MSKTKTARKTAVSKNERSLLAGYNTRDARAMTVGTIYIWERCSDEKFQSWRVFSQRLSRLCVSCQAACGVPLNGPSQQGRDGGWYQMQARLVKCVRSEKRLSPAIVSERVRKLDRGLETGPSLARRCGSAVRNLAWFSFPSRRRREMQIFSRE